MVKLRWADVGEEDWKDYDPDELGYGPSGEVYDSQSVNVTKVKLIGIIV